MTHDITLQPEVLLTPLIPAAPREGGVVNVLVQIKAPPIVPLPDTHFTGSRPPLRLALVVDCCVSMSGQPLNDALQCIRHIVARLTPTDQVAVVLYDDQVKVLMPLQMAEMAAAAISTALSSVDCGGGSGSALFAGWAEGARLLADAPLGASSRIILFSAGRTNEGLNANTAKVTISEQCALWQTKGICTTTVGLGGNFNHELLTLMAQAGGGQQYSGYGVHDLCAGFDQELGLYSAPFLSDITVILQPCDGVMIVEPAGANPSRLRQHVYQLPDLVLGSESTLLVRLQVEPDERVMRPLLMMKLRATSEMDQCMLQMGGFQLALENIEAEALAALPHDEVVAARMKLEEVQK